MPATLIAPHTRIVGSVSADGDLVVEGQVEGSVRAKGQLTLGPAAQVTGDLEARDVRIAGKLSRTVRAAGVIHLLATAEVRGDLHAARVIIDDGAVFEGQVRLARATPAATTHVVSPKPVEAPRPLAPRIVPARTTERTAERRIPELPTAGRRLIQRRQA